MDRTLKETVYTPDSELLSFGRLRRSIGRDLLASRELAWRLLVRNISAQYRQSVLGYAWAFLPPLFTTAIWVFLQSQRVFNVTDVISTAVFQLIDSRQCRSLSGNPGP